MTRFRAPLLASVLCAFSIPALAQTSIPVSQLASQVAAQIKQSSYAGIHLDSALAGSMTLLAIQQTAAAALPASKAGAANGVATLGAAGTVPASQLLFGSTTGTVADGGILTQVSDTAAAAANAIANGLSGSNLLPQTVLIDPSAVMTDAQVPTAVCASPAAVAAGNIAVPGQACVHGRFPNASYTQYQINGESDQGGRTYYNVQLGVTGNAMSGAGLFWNFNPVLTLQPGSNGGTNEELDVNNFGCDSGTFAAGTAYGGTAGCVSPVFNSWLTGNSQFLITAYQNFASAGRRQAHVGQQFLGDLVQESIWFEKTNSALALDLEGTHASDIDTRASTCLRDCVEMYQNQGIGWYSSAAGMTTAAAYNAGIGIYLGGHYIDPSSVYHIRSGGAVTAALQIEEPVVNLHGTGYGTAGGASGSTIADQSVGLVLGNTVGAFISAPNTMIGTNGGLVADATAPAQINAPAGANRGYVVNSQGVEQGFFGFVDSIGVVLRTLVAGQPLTLLNSAGAFVAKFSSDGTFTLGGPAQLASITYAQAQGTATSGNRACAASTVGQLVVISDGRTATESAGQGSGVPAICLQSGQGGAYVWFSQFSGAAVTN